MRILIYPNSFNVGGAINSIELAAAVRDRGHEVTLLGRPGPLMAAVRQTGLEHVSLDPGVRRRPSRRAAAQVAELVRRRAIDVVHGYEWPATVEACAGARVRRRCHVVSTIYSAMVPPFLPRGLPLIVGAEETRQRAVEAGHAGVAIIEPPVDVHANAPGHALGPFREHFGFGTAPLLAVVCRLAREGKLEGLLAACDAVGRLAAAGEKIQLAIVGDGPARPAVAAAAAAANSQAGRTVVVLTGELIDPRPAYAAADMVFGMGGSALRGMAFGKPLIVQGEHGFWRLLTPESAPAFLYHGWYGLGADTEGRAQGAERLERILRELLAAPDTWGGLGGYGRSLIVGRFGLEQAAAAAEAVYLSALHVPAARNLTAAAAAAAWGGASRHQASRKWRRWRGKTVPSDDFNAIAASPECWLGVP